METESPHFPQEIITIHVAEVSTEKIDSSNSDLSIQAEMLVI